MWTRICSNRSTEKEKEKMNQTEELKKIKIDMKCSDLVQELEKRGHVVCTYDDDGVEFVEITPEGVKWFDKMSKLFKSEGLM